MACFEIRDKGGLDASKCAYNGQAKTESNQFRQEAKSRDLNVRPVAAYPGLGVCAMWLRGIVMVVQRDDVAMMSFKKHRTKNSHPRKNCRDGKAKLTLFGSTISREM